MRIESIVHLSFSEEEIKEAMIMLLEMRQNDLVPNDPEFDRLDKLIKHAKKAKYMVEIYEGRFVLLLDGIAEQKEVKVL